MTVDAAVLSEASRLLDALIGLRPDGSFLPRLSRALRDVADARGIDPHRLLRVLAADPDVLDELLDRITVQETSFFRHREQFDALTATVLPGIDGPVRTWVAASANGQEAYTVAMLVAERGAGGSVLATDVSPAALDRTVAGRYRTREMGGVSSERRRRHFVLTDDTWEVRPHLRDLIVARRHNLLDPIPDEVRACQLVLCRNVLIYFAPAHAQDFLTRLADAMHPDALLFVGGAETLWHVSDRFEPEHLGDCFAFRPVSRVRPSPLPRAGVPRTATAPPSPPTKAAPVTPAAPVVPVPSVPSAPPVAPTAPVAPASGVDPESGPEQARIGRERMSEGDTAGAVVAFRRWAYLDPDDPDSHFHLGSALERTGDTATARRAYRAALDALERGEQDPMSGVLQGYDRAELRRLLLERTGAHR